MDLNDALEELRRKRGAHGQALNKDDIERAVKQLRALGEGFQIVRVGAKKMLQSVPYQLSDDHTTVLQLAQTSFFVTVDQLKKELGWNLPRCELVLNELLEEGMAWIDVPVASTADPTRPIDQVLYWFPTLYFGSITATNSASVSSAASSSTS